MSVEMPEETRMGDEQAKSGGAERRQFPRLREACKIRVRPLAGMTTSDPGAEGVTVNISGGGLCYMSEERYEPGTFLAVELTLPEFPSAVVALARTSFASPEGPPHETGLEFWWVGWDDNSVQQQISTFIKSELSERSDTSEHTGTSEQAGA